LDEEEAGDEKEEMKKHPTVYFIVGSTAGIGKSVLANTLESEGIVVLRSYSTAESIHALANHYALGKSIFMDVDGKDLHDSLNQINRMIPIFVKSGYRETRIIFLCGSIGQVIGLSSQVPKSKRGGSRAFP
jgi:NADP-dependent 3-hydroxy acid dehydrogenase YdfG